MNDEVYEQWGNESVAVSEAEYYWRRWINVIDYSNERGVISFQGTLESQNGTLYG